MFKNSILMVLLALLLVACAKSDYSVGNDFSSEQVNNIVKGETTTEQLVSWFGQPYSKIVISENETKWMYVHTKGEAKMQSYLVTAKYTSSGTQKTLDILVKNNIVVNYTFTSGPIPGINVN